MKVPWTHYPTCAHRCTDKQKTSKTKRSCLSNFADVLHNILIPTETQTFTSTLHDLKIYLRDKTHIVEFHTRLSLQKAIVKEYYSSRDVILMPFLQMELENDSVMLLAVRISFIISIGSLKFATVTSLIAL